MHRLVNLAIAAGGLLAGLFFGGLVAGSVVASVIGRRDG